MASEPIFRFAPSPNGRLHLGHAFSALFTARAARGAGGIMLLRIEDIDRARSKPEFDAGIMEDLSWLGLDWPEPVLRQASRFSDYSEAAARLDGLLYPCFCSRAEIAAAASATDPDGAPLYPGTCRHVDPQDAATRIAAGEPYQLRLRMDVAIARAGRLTVTEMPVVGIDLKRDRITARPAEPARWGDVVIVRKDTPTSYHLSVVLDDAFQEVTHVTRGMDLYAATDLHVLLQALLQLPSPVYSHHGLILDEAQQKLSKSKGSPSLASLRAAGWTPDEVKRALGF